MAVQHKKCSLCSSCYQILRLIFHFSMDKGKKWCCIPRIIPDFSFLSCRFNCKKSFLKFFVTLKCFIHVGKWWIYVVSLIQNAYFLNISEDSIFSCMKVFVTFLHRTIVNILIQRAQLAYFTSAAAIKIYDYVRVKSRREIGKG